MPVHHIITFYGRQQSGSYKWFLYHNLCRLFSTVQAKAASLSCVFNSAGQCCFPVTVSSNRRDLTVLYALTQWQMFKLPNILTGSLGGNGLTWSPRSRFAVSNLAEVDAFFQDVEVLSTSPLGGTLSRGSLVWDFRLVKETQILQICLWAKSILHIHAVAIS